MYAPAENIFDQRVRFSKYARKELTHYLIVVCKLLSRFVCQAKVFHTLYYVSSCVLGAIRTIVPRFSW